MRRRLVLQQLNVRKLNQMITKTILALFEARRPIFQVILLEKFLGSKVSMGHLTNQLIRLVNPKSHQNGKRVKRGLLSYISIRW